MTTHRQSNPLESTLRAIATIGFIAGLALAAYMAHGIANAIDEDRPWWQFVPPPTNAR